MVYNGILYTNEGEAIMNEYYLFLDEIKPNTFGTYFALGGYAIKKEDYENILKPNLQKIKIENMPDPDLPLHLYDMRKNIKGFEFLTDNDIRVKLFEGIKKLIKELERAWMELKMGRYLDRPKKEKKVYENSCNL